MFVRLVQRYLTEHRMKSATSALEKYSEKYATSERCENYMKLSKKRYEETLQRLEVRKCELRKEREDVILKFGEVGVLFFSLFFCEHRG